jgi:hypothetical protein
MLSRDIFDWSSSGTVRLEQLADFLGCFLVDIRRWLLPPPPNLACTQIPARNPRNSKPILLGRKNLPFLMTEDVIIPWTVRKKLRRGACLH